MRQLEKTNISLKSQNQLVTSQMSTMKNLLTEERSKVTLLQIEIDRVTAAANELRNVMSASPGGSSTEKGTGRNDDVMTKSLGDWIREGVCDVFSKFDKDNDSVLNAREMNTLVA